jgi:hypothetical protein
MKRMRRRGFFQRTFSGLLAMVGLKAQPGADEFRALASIVLPASLGRSRMDKIADGFASWVRDYKAGAEIASGYGNPRTQVIPPNPSTHYAEQLAQLGLAKLNASAKRAAVEKALLDAHVDRIPSRPNGRHVAADLLAYFYNSADGEDFLYGVAIKRDDCRGLADSGKRPEKVS